MKRVFILLLLTAGMVYPQGKYLVYFNDKGAAENTALSKSSAVYQKALNLLSPKAVERRLKVLDEDSLITYEDLPVNAEYTNALSSAGIKIINTLNWFNAVSANLSKEQLAYLKTQNYIKKIEKVKSFIYRQITEQPERVMSMSKAAAGDSLFYGLAWQQLKMSDIPKVHAKGITGSGVIMGVLDSGFGWKDHDVFAGLKVMKEYDFVNNDAVTANEANDAPGQDSHGTFVLSVIGGYSPDNLIGGAYGSTFLLAKTENVPTETHVEEDNYARALEWMENQGVDITTSSLSYNEFDAPEQSYTYQDMNGRTTVVTKAAELAFRRGVLVLTAAGNEGNKTWHYISAPADGKNVIAVGALSSSGSVAAFSSRGPSSDGRIKPDISALGVSVWGATAHSKLSYGTNSGTSLSTPIAASAASLLLSTYPYLTNVQARIILMESCANSDKPDNDRGYGAVSAVRAIEFPNLQKSGDGFILHRTFLDSSAVVPSSVRLFYTTDSVNYALIPMTQERPGFYSVNFPAAANGKNVSFFFRYTDKSGTMITEPEAKRYNFTYGNLVVTKNLKFTEEQVIYPDNFVLGQNYPNPFNSMTRIDFKAAANESAKLFILNSIGEQVKVIERVTSDGINTIMWDSRNEAGVHCASGVYYYILRLSGKDYGKKMLLLK